MLRHLLVLFASGVVTSGGEGGTSCVGIVGVGVGSVGISREALMLAKAATTREIEHAGSSPTAVAAWPHRRQRHLPAMAAVVVGAGRLQEMVKTWKPECF
jgi:hypothetical protein